MADFDKAITTVLKNEGGLVNNPSDPGGITNFGISLNFYKTINANATPSDIKNLTQDMAISIYRSSFWDRNKYNMIANQKVATKVFDACVTMDIDANKCLQRAASATLNRPVIDDGILGPNSLYAINYSNQDQLYGALKAEIAGHYRLVAISHPDLEKFLAGWLKRAYSDM